jgi:molybdopterin synthase catalytic subunit
VEYGDADGKAEQELGEIAAEVARRHPVSKVAIYHRVGKLSVGDINLVVAIAAAHRGEGFAASQDAIDLFKKKLPTSKKETYTDGSVWTGD